MNDLITDNSQIMFVDDGRKDKTRKFNEGYSESNNHILRLNLSHN